MILSHHGINSLASSDNGIFAKWLSELNPVNVAYLKKDVLYGNEEFEYIDVGVISVTLNFEKTPKLVEFDIYYNSNIAAIVYGLAWTCNARSHYLIVPGQYPGLIQKNGTSYDTINFPAYELSGNAVYEQKSGYGETWKVIHSTTACNRPMHYKYEIDASTNKIKVTVTIPSISSEPDSSATLTYEMFSSLSLYFHIEGANTTSARKNFGFKNIHIVY